MTKEKMVKLLSLVSGTGNYNSSHDTPYSRKQLTEYVKDRNPELYPYLQEAWRKAYIRPGRVYGFLLTRKGYEELDRLKSIIIDLKPL